MAKQETTQQVQTQDDGFGGGIDFTGTDFTPPVLTREQVQVAPEVKPDDTIAENVGDDIEDNIEDEKAGDPETSEDKTDEKSEEKADDPESLFEDLEIDSPSKDGTKEGVFDYSALAERLSLENVKDEDTFVSALQSKEEEIRSQVTNFPNKDVKAYVDKIIKVAEDGGNFLDVVSSEAKIDKLTKELEANSKRIETIRSYRQKGDAETDKKFLQWFYGSSPRIKDESRQELISGLAELEDSAIAREAQIYMTMLEQQYEMEGKEFNSTLESEKAAQAKTLQDAAQHKELAQKAFDKALTEYKDPEGIEKLSERTKKLAKKAFSTKTVNFSMPEGIAQQLGVYNSQGEFDMSSIIANIGKIQNHEILINHLKKKAKVGAFRERQNFDDKGGKGRDNPGKSKTASDDFGHVSFGDKAKPEFTKRKN